MAGKYHRLEKGDVLKERYRIEQVLGVGGFGVTYKAIDTYMDVPVAIKEYNHEDLTGYEEAAKEAKIVAGFYDLDSIASARDFFTENNLAYIVMDYVNGISIKHYIKENGAMGGETVLKKVKPLIEALIKIHDTGVIHRDISADNLMITKDKKLVLIDFGAARFMKEYENKDYTVIIKKGFSPIEQCQTTGKQGPYTDVYSLCATLYYMVTGIVPNDCVERMLADNIVHLSQFDNTGLSQTECNAIMKGISIWAKHRHQSMEELYKALYDSEDIVAAENDLIITDMQAEGDYQSLTKTGSTVSMYRAVKEFYSNKSTSKKRRIFILSVGIVAAIIICVVAVVIGYTVGSGINQDKDYQKQPVTNQLTASPKDSYPMASDTTLEDSQQVNDTAQADSFMPPVDTGAPDIVNTPKPTKKAKATKKTKATKKPVSKPTAKPTDKPKASENEDNNKKDDFFSADLDNFLR
ncbi:MAG: serine/threonine protein kinase [Lachnospiraceae bacterium]|nr:serine/threonine protein kinase [Lachnospiraceae bacterium]